MDTGRQRNLSSLFLVRLWVDRADEAAEDDTVWRGRVVHVLSGQAYDFRDWHTLSRLLLELLQPMPGPEATPGQETHDY